MMPIPSIPLWRTRFPSISSSHPRRRRSFSISASGLSREGALVQGLVLTRRPVTERRLGPMVEAEAAGERPIGSRRLAHPGPTLSSAARADLVDNGYANIQLRRGGRADNTWPGLHSRVRARDSVRPRRKVKGQEAGGGPSRLIRLGQSSGARLDNYYSASINVARLSGPDAPFAITSTAYRQALLFLITIYYNVSFCWAAFGERAASAL
jgi:hypothetical protein